jgi:hypothetical protein
MRSIRFPSRLGRDAPDRATGPRQGDREGVGHRGLGRDVAELDAQVDDRLRDLGPDAADDALGPHQAGRGHGLQEVLRGEGVDRRHPGDVDDGDAGAGLHDLLQQVSMTIWVRALSSVPIMGNARMPSQSFTTGVESSSISCCWRAMTSSRAFCCTSVV